MEKNVLNTDLSGKVAVVTGASGTLWFHFRQGSGPGQEPKWLCWAATWKS